MTPTQKIGRKRSQRTELSRDLPQKAVGVSGVLAAPTPGVGREEGPQVLEGAARRRSGSPRVRRLALAALRPAASHAALSAESFQRTPDRGEPERLKSAIRAAPEHPTSTPIPGAASSGVRTRFRAAAPLPVCGEAALRATPAEPERGCLVASLSPLFLRSFSPSLLPGPCRCPRSLYTCWGSPGWALDVNFPAWQRNKQLPRPWKGGPWKAGGGFPGRG